MKYASHANTYPHDNWRKELRGRSGVCAIAIELNCKVPFNKEKKENHLWMEIHRLQCSSFVTHHQWLLSLRNYFIEIIHLIHHSLHPTLIQLSWWFFEMDDWVFHMCCVIDTISQCYTEGVLYPNKDVLKNCTRFVLIIIHVCMYDGVITVIQPSWIGNMQVSY